MNKLLTKTVNKVNLLSVILAVIFTVAVVVTALLGINYASNLKDSASLTVTVNYSYFNDEDKLSAIEGICEKELDKLDINYRLESAMAGDDCEIVYYFDANVYTDDAEKALEAVFNEKTKEGGEWDGAFITVASNTEKSLTYIPTSYFVRTAIAVAVISVLSFAYLAIRQNVISGIVAGVNGLLGGVMTASIVLLSRIPFTSSSLSVIACASLLTTVISVLSLSKYKRELKKEDKSITTAEEVVSASATKESVALAIVLGISLVLTGAIATTAVRWFSLTALIAVDVSLFIGLVFTAASYLPLRKAKDEKLATRTKYGYVGAKKNEDEKAE